MKASTTSTKASETRGEGFAERAARRHPRLWTVLTACGFYAMMMALFLYFMLANLSSAPKFVYTQF